MSLKAMPLLFLNMGGEMIYILDQRLHAQDVHQGKAERVLDDILGLMCTGRFVEELFRPQPLYSSDGLRTIFCRLAHSSIMRLNKSSMDKLYDLMVMVFKYQMEQCSHPRQLLMVTLNHLDQMALHATAPRVKRQIDTAYDLLVQCYGGLSEGEMQDIRFEILNFFLDYRVKVSIFLEQKRQNANGSFVIDVCGPLPEGVAMPGEIRYFDDRGEICDTARYPCKETLSAPLKPASLARGADRGTTLGTNIYRSEKGEAMSAGGPQPVAETPPAPAPEPGPPAARASQALDLLAQLIGQTGHRECEVRLSLPGPAAAAGAGETAQQGDTVVGTRSRSQHLERVMQDMTVDGPAGGPQDLLHMMDNIAD